MILPPLIKEDDEMSWFSKLFGRPNMDVSSRTVVNEGIPAQPLESSGAAVQEPVGSKEVDLTINADGTISHLSAGLSWQADDDGTKRNWDDAEKYCSELSFAGFDDWRLPSLSEFQSLEKAAREAGITINTVFSRKNEGDYWSSTPGPASNVAYVALGETMFRTNRYYVRAVRSV
jgi:hypothetical protein